MRLGWVVSNLESADDFRKAGVVRSTAELTSAVLRRSRNHDIVLYARDGFAPPPEWTGREIRRTWRRYNKWMALLGGAAARRDRLDFLFSLAEAVPRYGGVKCGLVIHDFFAIDHPEWVGEDRSAHYRNVLGHAWRTARAIVTNSAHTAAEGTRIFGAPAGLVRPAPFGPGSPPIAESAPRDPELADGRYLFTLSTIEPRKNLGRLFEAFSLLLKRPETADLRLVVGGGKGWMYESALARIEELGIGSRVTMLGYVADERVPGLYEHAAAYVCPSLKEGFGLPILEAMLAGTPVVSSHGGALPEVGGTDVAYFDPTDAKGMANAISADLADPNRGERAARALLRAREFTWDRCADLTLDAIEEGAGR